MSVSVGSKDGLGPAPTRLRQIALVAHDLERAKKLLTYVLGTEVIFEDPAVGQWGLKNFLIPLGGDFIEVVAPVRDGTTAGRLLEKRGEGGYMIIMQTEDATQRRKHIEAKGLAKVIFHHDYDHSTCVQYHPKGIKGGMMPELDSHDAVPNNPTPLQSRFSPWHACGPDHQAYFPGMQRAGHLSLEGCVLRLQPEDQDHEAAARQWEGIFGVNRSRDLLAFTNARLGFVPGRAGQAEGLVSITVGVTGAGNADAIHKRAGEVGALADDGGISMCGIRWNVTLTGHGTQAKL